MKKLFILLFAAGFLVACGEKSADTEETATTEEASTEEAAEASAEENGTMPGDDEVGNFGAEVDPQGAVAVGEVPAMLEGQDSVFVKVKGAINACCQKKGCWMTMAMGDDEMMVRFKDYGFFVPKGASGKEAVAEGWAYRSEISVDELRHYAEDEGKSEEEIAAITEPEVQITFMADGVVIAEAEGSDSDHEDQH